MNTDAADGRHNEGKRPKWVLYERTHSNSMWHTGYKQLPDGRWFICYMDDASRFVTAWGVFTDATTDNALKILDEGIKHHGKPASIMTGRLPQFYGSGNNASRFEKRLVELDIRQMLTRSNRSHTNGKLKRFYGELHRKLRGFEESSYGNAVKNPVSGHVGGPFNTKPAKPALERFMEWYNHDRAHMSLDWDNMETPAQAFRRMMAPNTEIVTDGQT